MPLPQVRERNSTALHTCPCNQTDVSKEFLRITSRSPLLTILLFTWSLSYFSLHQRCKIHQDVNFCIEVQKPAVFPQWLAFISPFGKGCTHVEHSLHTPQTKTGHSCPNKSLSVEIKQTPISSHLPVWTGLNLKTEFLNKAEEFSQLVHPGTPPVSDTLYMSQPLPATLKEASKIQMLYLTKSAT